MSPLRDTHRTSASTFETNPSAYGGLSNGHTSSPCTAFRISIDKLMLRVVCSESRSWRVMVEGDDPAAMRPPSTTHNPLPNAWRATGESSSSVCVSSAGSSVFGDTHCPTDCSTVQAKVPVPKPSKAKVGVPIQSHARCPHARRRWVSPCQRWVSPCQRVSPCHHAAAQLSFFWRPPSVKETPWALPILSPAPLPLLWCRSLHRSAALTLPRPPPLRQ